MNFIIKKECNWGCNYNRKN